jgi:hypothetical protein
MGCKLELPGLLQLSNAEQNMSIRLDNHIDPGTRVCEVNKFVFVTLVLYSFVFW